MSGDDVASEPPTAQRPAARRPDRRLQQLGGAAAVAAGGVTALAGLPADVPGWLGVAGSLVGALLLPVAAVLLVKAFVGDRAPLGWAKLGGIMLIIYSCWWLVLLALPLVLSPGPSAMVVTSGSEVVRIVVGLAAAAAIAARWPVRGFNRWSMLVVVAGDIVSTQLAWLAAPAGSVPLMLAMGLAWPLSVVALGIGHALSGRRRLGEGA